MGIASNYKFSNKKHPLLAVMAVILAVMAFAAMLLAVYLTYKEGGTARFRYGMVCLTAMAFSVTGEVLSVIAYYGKERYPLFPMLGMILNAVSILAGVYILYAGFYYA